MFQFYFDYLSMEYNIHLMRVHLILEKTYFFQAQFKVVLKRKFNRSQLIQNVSHYLLDFRRGDILYVSVWMDTSKWASSRWVIFLINFHWDLLVIAQKWMVVVQPRCLQVHESFSTKMNCLQLCSEDRCRTRRSINNFSSSYIIQFLKLQKIYFNFDFIFLSKRDLSFFTKLERMSFRAAFGC